jgi:3-oxoadipate enol-lactonase
LIDVTLALLLPGPPGRQSVGLQRPELICFDCGPQREDLGMTNEHECSVNGTTIHYRIDGTGDGPVLMLSNSLASNLHMWNMQVEPLEMEGFRVLRYDSRGHGRSGVPAGPYTIETLADDAVGLLDHLGIEKVHFCGLSKGGMVGQMLGARHADRLITLTIADSAAQLGTADTWNDRITLAREGGMESVVDSTIERWFTPHGQERIPAEVEEVRGMILSTPVEGFAACCGAIRDMDLRESNKQIRTPTLVIVGDKDPSTTPTHAREIADAVRGAKVEIIPDAMHLSNIEQPVAFTNALLDHVMPHSG